MAPRRAYNPQPGAPSSEASGSRFPKHIMVIISKPPMRLPNSNQPQITTVAIPEPMPARQPRFVLKDHKPEKIGTTRVIVTMSAMEKRSVIFTAKPSKFSFVSRTATAAKITQGTFKINRNNSPMSKLGNDPSFLCIRVLEITEFMPVWKESAHDAIMHMIRMYIISLKDFVHCSIS